MRSTWQIWKLRQSHTSRKWQRPDLNPDPLASESMRLTDLTQGRDGAFLMEAKAQWPGQEASPDNKGNNRKLREHSFETILIVQVYMGKLGSTEAPALHNDSSTLDVWRATDFSEKLRKLWASSRNTQGHMHMHAGSFRSVRDGISS